MVSKEKWSRSTTNKCMTCSASCSARCHSVTASANKCLWPMVVYSLRMASHLRISEKHQEQENQVTKELCASACGLIHVIQMEDIQVREVLVSHSDLTSQRNSVNWITCVSWIQLICNHFCIALVVRSHEVKPLGYEYQKGGKCLTVFSAPNYCDQMGNKGAFIRFKDKDMKPEITSFEHV